MSPSPFMQTLRGWGRERVATLFPGYFALVMATAILAQDLRVQGLPPPSMRRSPA